MPAVIKYTVKPTFRDVAGRWEKATGQVIEGKQDAMRLMARRFVVFAADEAPERTGKFKKGIRWRTFKRGENVGFTVTTPQPLGKFILEGTKPHEITPKGPGYPLRFFWEKVGKVAYAYRVWHPGTAPNPFIQRAVARWIPLAQWQTRQIALRASTEFSSGK